MNFDTRESDLRTLFEGYGDVDTVKIIVDRDTGRSKGFGFVEMPDDEQAQSAIDALNDQEFDGRTIVVKKAEPRAPRNDRRGGFNRDRRGGGGGGYNRGGYDRGGSSYDRRY